MSIGTTRTVARQRTHVVTGEPELVRAALARAHEEGRLVRLTDGDALPDGRVRVTAELLDVTGGAGRRWLRSVPRPTLLQVVTVLVALAALAGLVWVIVLAVLAIVAAVTAAIAWVQAHAVLIIVGAVVLLLLCCGGAASCAGLHCGGCRG